MLSIETSRKRAVPAIWLFAFILGAGASVALAGTTQAVLSVNLASPGADVSRITFFVQSPSVGTQVFAGMAPVSVSSPAGTQRRLDGTATTTTVSFVGANLVKVTLTPLRVWPAGTRVSFILMVAGTNSIRIPAAAVGGAAPPAWFRDVLNPAGNGFIFQTIPGPGPVLPGFTGIVNDADLTLYNDLNVTIGMQNLLILPNIGAANFANLDLDALFSQSFNPSLPSFTLLGSASQDFPSLPDPAQGNVLAAEGQILDSSSNLIGTFAAGVTRTIDIGASVVNPQFAGTPGHCPTNWACDGSPDPGFASYAASSAQYPGGPPFPTSSYSPTVWAGSGTIRQDTPLTWVGGNTYLLNFWTGLPNTEPDGASTVAGWPPTVRLYLRAAGGAQVAAFDIPSPGKGQFIPNLITFTLPSNSPFAGQNIGVLIFVSASPNGLSANFDIAPVSIGPVLN